MKDIFITKASGEKSKFSEDKLRKSLSLAGATTEKIDTVLKEIDSNLYEGISTKKIYRMAFDFLRGESRHMAARYHLKQAIMELGPSGFPFEKFIAEILNVEGYKTMVDKIVQGKCVSHEIDVIAEKDDHLYMIECKYHNQRGKFSDVQIPLYIQSRFKDVEAQWLKNPEYKTKTMSGWVVTNTRFSVDAILYGTCAGLTLLGWDYPIKSGLKDRVDRLGLYPVTCLTSLTKVEKQRLLDKKIVLCKEIYNNEPLLEAAGIKNSRIRTVMKEAKQLCQYLINDETGK